MFSVAPDRKWSEIGLAVLISSLVILVLLVFADAALKASSSDFRSSEKYLFVATVVVDFRYVFEQVIYAATIFFVGAKFFETRTILTIGFDKADAKKMSVRGPDENNVVWIGHRYASKLEAEAISATIAERLGPPPAMDANP